MPLPSEIELPSIRTVPPSSKSSPAMSAIPTAADSDQDPERDATSPTAVRTPRPIAGPMFRSVPFQIVVACGVSFTAPGMWDALGGLGAGGAAEPYVPPKRIILCFHN